MKDALRPVSAPISLEKLTYDSIKKAIVSFQLVPGQSLVESELAARLGVSKTPVRDALLRLEREGFVKKIAYTGTYVAEINRKSIVEIFTIRATLEGLAVNMVCGKFSKDDVTKGQTYIDEMEVANQNNDIRTAALQNERFHSLIIARTESEWLSQILSNLDDHLKRYRILSNYQVGRLGKSTSEHQRVLDAIVGGDCVNAEKLMKQHIISVLEDLESQDDFDILVEKVSRNSEK